jgi:hypothetical protein
LRKDFADASRQDSKKNELKPHLKQTWCIGKINAQFIAQMERILWLYALPYDPRYPVICYDERPCFLIGEEIDPLPLQSGRARKEHYAYEKNGSCSLLAAIEPLTGKRLAQVHPQRTKREYTLFCLALAAAYPKAKKIRLVQDNLNTHNASAFYENLPAAEAFALARAVRVPLHAEVRELAQYDRDRILGRRAPVFRPAHPDHRTTGERSSNADQRTS